MAEADAKTAPVLTQLPDDSELLAFLERAVDEVFVTMIGACQKIARFEGRHPDESSEAQGGLVVQIEGAQGVNMRVQHESVVEFRGPFDGRVSVRACEAGATAIARGLLMSGPDDQLTVEEVDDALKECANMLTGWVKSQALDPFGTFSMSVPFLWSGPREVVGSACGALAFQVGAGRFLIEASRRPKSALGSTA